MSVHLTTITQIEENHTSTKLDQLAIEEPLEISLSHNNQTHAVSITMRTPTNDKELALGFLFTEGILQHIDQLETTLEQENTIQIILKPNQNIDLQKLQRHFYTSSSCGVCGKTSIEAIYAQAHQEILPNQPTIKGEVIHFLPDRLRAAQILFQQTGGIHAAGLFNPQGELLALREDVGRHNALDKLIGYAFLERLVPVRQHILLLSGRISFELVQKAYMAGIPIIAAVGAPSSLALQLAQDTNITLIGFIRAKRYNIYTHPERILRVVG